MLRPAVTTPTVVASLPADPVHASLHHERHVYVLQPGLVTVVDPRLNVTRHHLDFDPVTWACYGGSVCAYQPDRGVVQLSGTTVTLERVEPGVRFSAPYAQPAMDGVSLGSGPDLPAHYLEHHGAVYQEVGPVRRYETFGVALDAPPTGLYSAPAQSLLLTRDRERFAFHNGAWGPLLHADAPELTVPQVLPGGLLIAGTEDGFVFSPDHGASWRRRLLGGFGIPTGRGMFRVREGQLELLRGRP